VSSDPAAHADLILASGSPRRRELLHGAGVRFRVVVPDLDEHVAPGEPPERAVARLALEKARGIVDKLRCALPVLAADTVVALDGAILGKPRDVAEAERMLTSLAGRTHTVWTGFALISGVPMREDVDAVSSQVTFRSLTSTEIEAYLATGESLDKAGAYAVQGAGAALIASIAGSRTNVIGLPMEAVVPRLVRAGVAVRHP
jgi:septum formation protein